MLYNYTKKSEKAEITDNKSLFGSIDLLLNSVFNHLSLKSSLTIPSRRGAVFSLMFLDWMVAMVSWIVCYRYRFNLLHRDFFWNLHYLGWQDVLLGLYAVPFFWCALYYISGTYFDLYRKSRYDETKRTLLSCLIGTFVIAAFAFSNDSTHFDYFSKSTFRYLFFHTILTLVVRNIVLTMVHRNIVKGKVGFNTLIIGGNDNAINIFKKVTSSKTAYGNIFKGFVYSSLESSNGMNRYLRQLGNIDELEMIIDKHNIEEVIVAVDSDEHVMLENILLQLTYRPVLVKIIPDLYDIISGTAKIKNIYDDTLFIQLNPGLLPDWQKVCKRVIDIVGALFALAILSPVYLFSSIKVWLSSPGPVVYRQERIGLYGQTFNIYKFRSMYVDAESAGPCLASDGDPRITKWGLFMRKYRIDELPQFFNVLKGDMSLVGPRPERQHFINIITASNPEYRYLHKVRPGITSLGMVKYGYAENVSQMTERMKFDLRYIENCSLALDFRIILHTMVTVIMGHGK